MKMLAKSIVDDVTLLKPISNDIDKNVECDLVLYEQMLQNSQFGYLYQKRKSSMVFEGDTIPTVEVLQHTGTHNIVGIFCESDGSYISSYVED